MRTLETNDWMVLNNIVYQIHSVEDLSQMRQILLEQLRLLIDFESANFYISSRDGRHTPVEPVFYNCPASVANFYMENYEKMDYAKGLMYSGKSMIYRETDIIKDEARVATDYYKMVYIPEKWHYSMSMVISYEGDFLGVLSLFRKKGEPNFEYEDIFVLEMLKDHLEFRLNRSIHTMGTGKEKLTVGQCTEQFQLTRREETILQLLVDGLDNDKICEQISISNNTLKKHILNIYRKLGIKNRVQMFKMVREKSE